MIASFLYRISIFTLLMYSQASGMQISKPRKKFLVIAHRGASGYAPENTLLSFKTALEMGAHAVELDVFKCKTGELVVIHDRTLTRTTGTPGLVEETTLEYLEKLDAGNGEKIPTLQEVFELVDRKARIFIELKGNDTAQGVAELINKYMEEKDWKPEDFMVISFDHYALKEFETLCPAVDIGALTYGIPIGYAAFGTNVGAQAVGLDSEFMNQQFVDDAHKRGMNVYVYTVNVRAEIHHIISLGVDGIISNYPDRVLAALQEISGF